MEALRSPQKKKEKEEKSYCGPKRRKSQQDISESESRNKK